MRKANFFLIGAAKAGTTSIARFLESCQDTYFSPIKEPCRFCPDINFDTRTEFKRQVLVDLDRYLADGMKEPLHMHQVEDPEKYARLFENAGDAKIIGECSTSYMPSDVAAKLIHDYNPDARIMAVLRDPVSRIRSHYLMDRRIGLERRPIEACIEEELSFGEAARFSNCRMYISQSDYEPHIKRFRDIFPDNQIMILKFEEVVADQATWLPRILEFLDLPSDSAPNVLPRENSADVMPRFRTIDSILYRTGMKSLLRYHLPKLLPSRVKEIVKNAYIGSGSKDKENLTTKWMGTDCIAELRKRYKYIRSYNDLCGMY